MALFPDVPIALGVPAIARDPLAAIEDVVFGAVSDLLSIFLGDNGPQWGIFQDGFPVVTGESVVSVEFQQGWVVAEYPLEAGSFESYDKVARPFDARIRFSAGADEPTRQNLLDEIDAIAGTTDLYDVVTPERVYVNVNVVRQGYRRTATNGVGLLQIDVGLIEIRQGASTTLSNTQSPTSTQTVNDGTVQPTTPSTAQHGSVTFVQ